MAYRCPKAGQASLLATTALTTMTILAACATTPGGGAMLGKDGYRKVFSEVLQKSLNAQSGNNVCLPPLFGFGETINESVEVRVDGEPGPGTGGSRQAQLKALESVGLVTGVESVRKSNDKTQRIVTYRRTEQGVANSVGASFCYARAELDRVVKWKGPIVLGEYQAAFVYYTVKTTHVQEWARSPAILAAFPTAVPIVNGEPAKLRQVAIDLSSEGWDVAEYSKLLQLQ
jgi:hypothetical protein